MVVGLKSETRGQDHLPQHISTIWRSLEFCFACQALSIPYKVAFIQNIRTSSTHAVNALLSTDFSLIVSLPVKGGLPQRSVGPSVVPHRLKWPLQCFRTNRSSFWQMTPHCREVAHPTDRQTSAAFISDELKMISDNHRQTHCGLTYGMSFNPGASLSPNHSGRTVKRILPISSVTH